MALIHNRCYFGNKQTVRLQETPDAIPEGETPHTVTLCFFDKLVDVAKPGDRVEVTGIFRAAPVRSSPIHRTLKSLYRVRTRPVGTGLESPYRHWLKKRGIVQMGSISPCSEGKGTADHLPEAKEQMTELAERFMVKSSERTLEI